MAHTCPQCEGFSMWAHLRNEQEGSPTIARVCHHMSAVHVNEKNNSL